MQRAMSKYYTWFGVVGSESQNYLFLEKLGNARNPSVGPAKCLEVGVWRIGREGLQTGFSRHGLPLQRALLDTVYPLREHLNSVQRMVSGGYCEGLLLDTVKKHMVT